jgi:hypothetical protein
VLYHSRGRRGRSQIIRQLYKSIGVAESGYEFKCRDAIYRVSTTVSVFQSTRFIHQISNAKKGNTAGVIFGMNPKVTDSNIPGFIKQDSSYHIEGFYQHKVNDNISITPGIIWVTAPGNDNNNDDAIVGTIRTTFTF